MDQKDIKEKKAEYFFAEIDMPVSNHEKYNNNNNVPWTRPWVEIPPEATEVRRYKNPWYYKDGHATYAWEYKDKFGKCKVWQETYEYYSNFMNALF